MVALTLDTALWPWGPLITQYGDNVTFRGDGCVVRLCRRFWRRDDPATISQSVGPSYLRSGSGPLSRKLAACRGSFMNARCCLGKIIVGRIDEPELFRSQGYATLL